MVLRAIPGRGTSVSLNVVRIVGEILGIETMAMGTSIRALRRLRKRYGGWRWRKRKGVATVELQPDVLRRAEVHWYEAHGVGRREMKVKRFLD